MATRRCVRCIRPEPAITLCRFTYEDTAYVLALCAEHEQRFESDMLGWVRLADTESRSVPPAPPPPAAMPRFRATKNDPPRNLVRVPFPVAQGGEIRHDDYPDPCPDTEVATWSCPGADRHDDERGAKYTANVLMQPRK